MEFENSQQNEPSVSDQEKWDTMMRQIEDACASGNFELVKKAIRQHDLSESDIILNAAAAFNTCLDVGDETRINIGSQIIKEFNVPQETIDERLIFFMTESLIGGYDTHVFTRFEKYFQLSEEIKKKTVKNAIEGCVSVNYTGRAKELTEYFSDLLGNVA